MNFLSLLISSILLRLDISLRQLALLSALSALLLTRLHQKVMCMSCLPIESIYEERTIEECKNEERDQPLLKIRTSIDVDHIDYY